MSTAAPAPSPPPAPPREPSLLAAVLSYLVPGLGQIYQGRVGKGVLFMVCLLGMFHLGQAMGDWRNVHLPRPPQGTTLYSSVWQRWHYAGQFWIGAAAWPALWQFYAPSDDNWPAHTFWQKFQRGPVNDAEERDMNDFLVNSDKGPDLGWVYTIVAGMLNILVIYDAYAGPVFTPAPAPRPEDDPAAKPQGVPA